MWPWGWLVVTLLSIAALYSYLRPQPKGLIPESLYKVTFDEHAIVVTDPRGGTQRVAWTDMTRVAVRTTDEGPFLPDVFWEIHAAGDDPAIVFPGGATGENELLAELQRRLPNFDNDQMIAAMGSTDNAYFPLWSTTPGMHT